MERFKITCEGLMATVPCFALAYILLHSWIDPMRISDGKWVRFGVAIMVLEFILVHSGGFMASWQGKQSVLKNEPRPWKAFAFLLAFYSLFAIGMAAAFKSWELLLIFTGVMIGRWTSIFTNPNHVAEEAMARSGISCLFYLLAMFGSVMLPIPEGGVTYSVLNEVYPDRGSGEWERAPERALAAGVFYFSALGVRELVVMIKKLGAPLKS